MKRPCLSVLICACLLFVAGSVRARTEYRWLYPLPQGNTLYDVDYFGTGTAVAVGAVSTVLITTNSGYSWAVISNAAGLSADLLAVCMIDAMTGCAVGRGGVIIRTSNGGTSWATVASGVSVTLNDVTFTGSGIGYAVGDSGTVLMTVNGGADWTLVPCCTEADLSGISFFDPDNGMAVGSGGVILQTTDGGTTWEPLSSGTTVKLNAVQCLTASNSWAVGGNIILETDDGGASWSALPHPDWWCSVLEDLSFAKETPDYAVGCFVGNILDPDVEPSIFILTEYGEIGLMHMSYKHAPNHMYGLSMLNCWNGLAVGKRGVIRRTSDGGWNWTAIGGPPPQYYPMTMRRLDFCGMSKGLVLTSTNDAYGIPYPSSFVLRTTDGGNTWARHSVGWDQGTRMLDVAFADENTAYAVGQGDRLWDVGGMIYRSSDGGCSWEEIWCSRCFPMQSCVSYLSRVDFCDEGSGIIIGSGGAVLTVSREGSVKSAPGTQESLNDVCMADTVTVFGVTGNRILRSADGGITWMPQNSGASATLHGVDFVDRCCGTVVGDGGTILRTCNGGELWLPQNSGTTEDLYCVSFSDALSGSAIGSAGTILRTDDGGLTWTHDVSPISDLADVYTFDRHYSTVIGGSWNIVARQTGCVSVFDAALSARADRASVQLEWSISDGQGVCGFRLYRRADPKEEFARLTQNLIPTQTREFEDAAVLPGEEYEFVLGVVFDDGSEIRSNPASAKVPAWDVRLLQNYPNPFNPSTAIRFSLPQKQHVRLTVYDVSGRLVRTLADRVMEFGDHCIEWDGRDRSGGAVGSGVYYYRLAAGKQKLTRKMVLIR